MAQSPKTSDDRERAPSYNPVMLSVLCAVLVAIATGTIFLVR